MLVPLFHFYDGKRIYHHRVAVPLTDQVISHAILCVICRSYLMNFHSNKIIGQNLAKIYGKKVL